MPQPAPFGIPSNTPRPDPRSGTAPQRRQGSPTDKALTLVLICITPLVCVGTSFWGVFSVMATASCGTIGTHCGIAVDMSILLMIVAPWVLWLIFSIWAVVRLLRKRPALWVMLLGLGVATVIYVAANVVLMTILG